MKDVEGCVLDEDVVEEFEVFETVEIGLLGGVDFLLRVEFSALGCDYFNFL